MKKLVLILGLSLVAGCASSWQDRATTATAEACDLAEGYIVHRESASEAEDRRDIARVRLGCDFLYEALGLEGSDDEWRHDLPAPYGGEK